ncbi:MAG: DUF3048 domain-containing protein [Armatimonadota bacterium]|nr:DUF3048 domain-containing protein [Armatimonadota bacterium]MDR7437810.1 DUF3048 domain-containing protein [Armatimonadota bacterium]MDR7473135.1 DUF3048 domain-containing protein [Armatimonadota bacterium]MDR7507611.1 DUF3048 domain-containing protein [Armatimonadota bacterium]MDR7509937.1 DUF3048 domain-containing protein [Armatimonadota bacterium]
MRHRTLSPLALAAVFVAACAGGPGRPSGSRPAPLPARWVAEPAAATERRPCAWVAVVVDNAIPARPQAGLSRAEVVYEVPTEAMITRYLALYCRNSPETVGPVRSLRLQFLDIARDYGAPVAHAGASLSALAAVARGAGPTVNQFWVRQPFMRVRSRPMPHNLYVSVPRLRRVAPQAPAAGLPWETIPVLPSPRSQTVILPYGPGYTATFVYRPETGRYRRFVGSGPDLDALTGEPVEVGAVLVLYARWWQVYEGPVLVGRVDLGTGGRLQVFAGGHALDGAWRREDRMILSDAAGRPLRLPEGPVWVAVLPPDHPVRVVDGPP